MAAGNTPSSDSGLQSTGWSVPHAESPLGLRYTPETRGKVHPNWMSDPINWFARCLIPLLLYSPGTGLSRCQLCTKTNIITIIRPKCCYAKGKKPWSLKKKILWQLGTLIGAPVGISLIAITSIPTMAIGIPVYVGRKIHNKNERRKSSKHKWNLAIIGRVTLLIIASPVIAAVHAGIGAPIMLAYVYGVVLISLCREGDCGVSTANGKGVKIEFDEDDGPIIVADDWRALKNASIGESSIEGLTTSVSSTSENPTDGRSVVQGRDRETSRFATLSDDWRRFQAVSDKCQRHKGLDCHSGSTTLGDT
uniref:E3 ubiquitin-protein ligase RNF19B-like n=1 Tax=Jaculus jaculus TaxID=51337 RepID=UPI001E1B1830|nr:E3 ubiquitin-protein ligase RNF19B-like [Jaculus jaculus]